MPDEPTPQPTTQLTISAATLDGLREIAARQNISLADALEQAISLSQLLMNAGSASGTQVLVKQGGRVQELKLVPGTRG